jgi:hypothetical protein
LRVVSELANHVVCNYAEGGTGDILVSKPRRLIGVTNAYAPGGEIFAVANPIGGGLDPQITMVDLNVDGLPDGSAGRYDAPDPSDGPPWIYCFEFCIITYPFGQLYSENDAYGPPHDWHWTFTPVLGQTDTGVVPWWSGLKLVKGTENPVDSALAPPPWGNWTPDIFAPWIRLERVVPPVCDASPNQDLDFEYVNGPFYVNDVLNYDPPFALETIYDPPISSGGPSQLTSLRSHSYVIGTGQWLWGNMVRPGIVMALPTPLLRRERYRITVQGKEELPVDSPAFTVRLWDGAVPGAASAKLRGTFFMADAHPSEASYFSSFCTLG